MRGQRHFMVMPRDLIRQANQFFRESGTTPYRGLCAAFNIFLHAYSEALDISIGSPFGPRCSGIEDLIGFFVNTVVLRTDLSGKPTFREMMKRVDQVVRGAIEHSDLTFDKLVECARPTRDSSRSPLFQVNFRAPREPYPALQIKGLTSEAANYVDNGTSKFDLALEIETSRGEACYFEYCVDLFKEETIVRMVADFHNLLRGLIAQPDISIDGVPQVRAIMQRVSERNTPLRN
jgi:non-ribosomal peptide synthetase component F